MRRAQRRRAARNFAISSRRSLCALKKKESRGAKRSTGSPRATAARTYSSPFASVNATSCTAVEPASRMWYPLTEMGFHCGVSSALYSIRSVAILSDAAGG